MAGGNFWDLKKFFWQKKINEEKLNCCLKRQLSDDTHRKVPKVWKVGPIFIFMLSWTLPWTLFWTLSWSCLGPCLGLCPGLCLDFVLDSVLDVVLDLVLDFVWDFFF